jgi:hypothetical protein
VRAVGHPCRLHDCRCLGQHPMKGAGRHGLLLLPSTARLDVVLAAERYPGPREAGGLSECLEGEQRAVVVGEVAGELLDW